MDSTGLDFPGADRSAEIHADTVWWRTRGLDWRPPPVEQAAQVNARWRKGTGLDSAGYSAGLTERNFMHGALKNAGGWRSSLRHNRTTQFTQAPRLEMRKLEHYNRKLEGGIVPCDFRKR